MFSLRGALWIALVLFDVAFAIQDLLPAGAGLKTPPFEELVALNLFYLVAIRGWKNPLSS